MFTSRYFSKERLKKFDCFSEVSLYLMNSSVSQKREAMFDIELQTRNHKNRHHRQRFCQRRSCRPIGCHSCPMLVEDFTRFSMAFFFDVQFPLRCSLSSLARTFVNVHATSEIRNIDIAIEEQLLSHWANIVLCEVTNLAVHSRFNIGYCSHTRSL